MVLVHKLESVATMEDSLPADVTDRFLKNLRQVAAPLGLSCRAALGYTTATGTFWVVANNTCPCSQDGEQFSPSLASCHAPGRQCRTVQLFYKERSAGTVTVCCDATAHPSLPATLGHLAVVTLRQIEMEQENALLRTDLSAGAESLQAVYDINSSAPSGRTNGDMLDRILTRAVSVQPGLRAVLWMTNNNKLEVRARRKYTAPCEARGLKDGLLGKVLATGTPLVAPNRKALAELAPSEPELRQATGAAFVPVRGRREVVGVLEVWDEQGEAAFDTRLTHLLTTLAFLAGMSIENEQMARAALESEYLQRDMEIASRIQKTLLLGRPKVEVQQLACGDAMMTPSLQIGGDFYDFFAYNNVLDVIVGDVMGKGIPAALLGAATKNHLLRAINNLMASNPGHLPELREVLAIVNAELFKQLAGMETFVTLCYARFDGNKREVQIIDCGHTKTVHALGREGKSNLLMGKNMPLGFSRVDIYEAITRPFDSGDVFFFYSDGVTEAKNPAGEDFGEERLADLVRALKRLNPHEVVEKVSAEVRAFAASPNPRDDITCVAVKILDMDATRASTRGSLEISSDKAVLPRVRDFMRDLCRENFQMAVTEEDLAKLEPAVVDTVRNIIHHAYEDMPDGKIRLEASLFVNRFSIRIYHRGEPFDPESSSTPLRGPHVDTVRYSRSKNGEHCVLLQTILKH